MFDIDWTHVYSHLYLGTLTDLADVVLVDHVQVVSPPHDQDHAIEVPVTDLLPIQLLDHGEEDLNKPSYVVVDQQIVFLTPLFRE